MNIGCRSHVQFVGCVKSFSHVVSGNEADTDFAYDSDESDNELEVQGPLSKKAKILYA